VVVPLLKVTVPVAAEGATVAVSVTLAPETEVEAATGVVSVVVVAVAAWALVTNASKNRSRIVRLPKPL
jgi:hypothetical protein